MARIAWLVAATLAALCLPGSGAEAQSGSSSRVWVSGHGSDVSGCGAPSNPCRTFQYVLSNVVAPNGEIDVLDPAGYGAAAIVHGVSIVNDGVGTAGVQAASGNAITINASYSDKIVLRGLTIEGLGTATNGVALTGSGDLTIEKCVISNMTGAGVSITPVSEGTVTIVDTTVSYNDGAGIYAVASGSGVLTLSLSRVKAVSNGYFGNGIGVDFTGSSASYGYLAIDSSFIAENATGLVTSATTPNQVTAFVTHSAIVNNSQSLNVGASTSVKLEKTSIASALGGQITNHGAIISFGDNAIADSVSGSSITTTPLQ